MPEENDRFNEHKAYKASMKMLKSLDEEGVESLISHFEDLKNENNCTASHDDMNAWNLLCMVLPYDDLFERNETDICDMKMHCEMHEREIIKRHKLIIEFMEYHKGER